MNERQAVIVADSGRARIFTLETDDPDHRGGGPRLVEREALVNPEVRMRGEQAVSDTRRGKSQAYGGGPSHQFEDDREGRTGEARDGFAKQTVEALEALHRERGIDRLLVVCGPVMLGALRPRLEPLGKRGIEIRERGENLSRLSDSELQDHLAAKGEVPARRRAGLGAR